MDCHFLHESRVSKIIHILPFAKAIVFKYTFVWTIFIPAILIINRFNWLTIT